MREQRTARRRAPLAAATALCTAALACGSNPLLELPEDERFFLLSWASAAVVNQEGEPFWSDCLPYYRAGRPAIAVETGYLAERAYECAEEHPRRVLEKLHELGYEVQQDDIASTDVFEFMVARIEALREERSAVKGAPPAYKYFLLTRMGLPEQLWPEAGGDEPEADAEDIEEVLLLPEKERFLALSFAAATAEDVPKSFWTVCGKYARPDRPRFATGAETDCRDAHPKAIRDVVSILGYEVKMADLTSRDMFAFMSETSAQIDLLHAEAGQAWVRDFLERHEAQIAGLR